MRRDFDAVFALPRAPEPPPAESLLRISTAGTGFNVRLNELSCVLPCAVVVPVPGARRGLLGLTAVRGQIMPLYALATLLELPGPVPTPRWILVAEAGAALGVDAVEGVTQVPVAAVREVASAGSRALLNVTSVVEGLRKSRIPPEQER
ncbi:MAG: chemotaxis protein CheW [Planctomycetota bacterium]